MRVLQLIGVLCVLTLSALLGISYYIAQNLSSPERRPLMAYHKSWLDTPEKHGLKIKQHVSKSGVPLIIAEPAEPIGQRGQRLRDQLQNPPKVGEIKGNLVLLHGRKGRKEDLLPVAERFCAVGYRCILLDMPAHGENQTPHSCFGTGENGSLASHTLLELQERYGWPPLPNYLWGMSMGGAFANKSLLSHPELWEKAIIVCSFSSLEEVVDGQLSKAGPLKTLMKPLVESFCSIKLSEATPQEWARQIKHPVFIAHGTDDDLIPIEHGEKLYESYASSQKEFIGVKEAGHSDILITAHPLYREMTEFLMAH